jgi:O-antigen/teichoic acid export membrane protein
MTDRRPDGLLRAGALLSSTALLSAVIGLVRSKIIAVAAGPTGVGVLAQMNQVAALVGAFCSLGLGVVAAR